jgi:hypothetical protein
MLSINPYAIEHTIMKYIKNGFYIPVLFWGLSTSLNQLFLPMVLCLKLCSFNYYYWFSHIYDYNFTNKKYNIVKQFVRFTDTGHIASFLYYFYPQFLPIAFNVHFIITVGYWLGRFCFDLQDTDGYSDTDIIHWYTNIWVVFNHGLAFTCFIWIILTDNECNNSFNNDSIEYTFYWIYAWFFLIYIPWRMKTGDAVYSILSNESSIFTKISYVFLIHLFVVIANMFGHFLQSGECFHLYTI